MEVCDIESGKRPGFYRGVGKAIIIKGKGRAADGRECTMQCVIDHSLHIMHRNGSEFLRAITLELAPYEQVAREDGVVEISWLLPVFVDDFDYDAYASGNDG